MRSPQLWWLVPVTGIVTLALIKRLHNTYHTPCSPLLWTTAGEDFEGFDNVTGIQTGQFIVPNIVHFLRMGPKLKEFNFLDTVCVLAAFKNQKPDKIFFHTDHNNFTGKYWDILLKTEGFADVIEFIPTKLPATVFGQVYDPVNHLYHAGDVLRIELLMKYGGIFLDNDCYVVQSMDAYRKYEFALSWDDGFFLGTQVLVAHKDARFLKLWLDSYRDNYYPTLWYYNAGERPTKTVLFARPELVHRVKILFGTHNLVKELYTTVWRGWRDLIVIHLLTRHYQRGLNFTLDGETCLIPDQFTEDNVLPCPITLRELVKDVYQF